jgi:hypothetical protein
MIHIHRWYKHNGMFGGIKQCRKCKKAKVVPYNGIYFVSDHEFMQKLQAQYTMMVEHNNARLKAGLTPSLNVDKPTRDGSGMQFYEEGIDNEQS